MRFVRAFALVGLVLLASALSSCGSSGSTTSSGAPASVMATGGPGLVGSWSLTGAALDSADLSTFMITLALTDTTASGFGGVNQYTTTFTSSPEGAFDFGAIAATKMAGPDAAMQAEQAYFALLDSVTGYTVSDKELDLFAGAQEVLIYSKAP